ncbi:MAG: alkaline phosphatase [Verrucomicrobiales bacterium]|nr:alkaline phosphatase [Verrucomicrobiales bacterium]
MKLKPLRLLPLSCCVLTAGIIAASAAPAVTRLNPPSALFTFGDPSPPYIARFAAGQRFDLQATLSVDEGKSITAASFSLDGGAALPGTVSITDLGSNRFSVALRAFSSTVAGVHTFTIIAVQNDAQTVQATGNLEIVGFATAGKKAKNIIYLIGDGMGIAHRTAARIITGNVKMGKAESGLAMDRLPNTALISVASLNSIVTDSAPGAACYSTGNKSNNNQEGVFPDDTTSGALNKWDNPRVEHMGSFLARTQGKALGIVSTADVEDATPASFAVHAQDRGAGTGICDMYLDEAVAKANLRVLMGGGRRWFLPQSTPGSGRVGSTTSGGADYQLPPDIAAGWGVPEGTVDPERDLILAFQNQGFFYASNRTTLNELPANEDRLLGLFHSGNMDIAMDKIASRRGGAKVGSVAAFPDQPMLDEMTDKALQVLSKNPLGFVLMIEGASIDKQAHNMDTERWILDTVEFDKSIARVMAFQEANPDTLIIVTADHECAGINLIGSANVTNATLVTRSTQKGNDGVQGVTSGTGPVPDGQTTLRSAVGIYDAAGFPQYTLNGDGYPTTMDVDFKLLIGYAGSGDRYEDWLTNPAPNVAGVSRDVQGDFFLPGQATGAGTSNAVHTASDIPLSAGGRGASQFTGVMDNTEVYFKALQAAVGGAK